METRASPETVSPPVPTVGNASPVGRALDRLSEVELWTWLLLTLVAAWTAYFTRRSLDIHHGLGTSSFDSALYDQGVWLLSRFDSPYVTLMGRNLFGDHASYVLLLMVPLYWVFPAAGTMFFAQSLVIALGAVPVYLVARRRLDSGPLAVAMAAVYLLHPAVSWTNLENFHPDSFVAVFVGFAIYAALERRWRIYAVSVALALLVKEDVSLVVVPLGVWVALKRDRRFGAITVAASVVLTLLSMFVVMRGLTGVPTRNTWRIPFGGPWELIETTLTNPTQLLDHLRSDGRLWYLWQMTIPVALMFLRKPGVAAISFLVLFTNVLSTFWYQYHIQYHYSLIAVPALVIGAVDALGAIPRAGVQLPRTPSLVLVMLAAVLAAYTWAPLPWSQIELAYWAPSHPVAEAARDILVEVPSDAVVSAHYRITPHLAHRREIYQFPNPFRIVLYGSDVSLEGSRHEVRAERVEYLVLQRDKSPEDEADWELIAPAFELVEANESWELYRRLPDEPLPAIPTVAAEGG